MRKLKSEFKKDYKLTEDMKKFFSVESPEMNFMGVWFYKGNRIFESVEPLGKHISIGRFDMKQVKEEDIKAIAEKFMPDKYFIQKGYNMNIIHIWEGEEKECLN